MSTGTYTREQLRALPSEMRKQYLRSFTAHYANQIIEAAKRGQTSTMIENFRNPNNALQNRARERNSSIQWASQIGIIAANQNSPTVEEIREALLEQFPDCSITYEEKWIQTSPGKQELKEGLVVDWS